MCARARERERDYSEGGWSSPQKINGGCDFVAKWALKKGRFSESRPRIYARLVTLIFFLWIYGDSILSQLLVAVDVVICMKLETWAVNIVPFSRLDSA